MPPRTTLRPRAAFVDFGRAGSLGELVAPHDPADVFTSEERRHCLQRDSLARWAGRLAAKRAVLDCLGLGAAGTGDAALLAEVEIVVGPHEGQCLEHLCQLGHRPIVRLSGSAAGEAVALGVESVALSISHERGLAVALAVPATG